MARHRPHRVAAFGILALALLPPSAARAEDVPVPINLQAELLFMIAGHDKNLAGRAGAEVRTLIVAKPADDSARGAAQFAAAARGKTVVAGLPHRAELLPFTTAPELAEACRSRRPAIVYLAPGFTGAEAVAIAEALEGVGALTASAAPALVRKGVVLGFDLVSGRARLLVDSSQAAKQRVAFGPGVLALMTVYP